MLESIKAFCADEKVQAFALGAVAGGLIAGGVTYFATRGRSTVETAINNATAKAADVADDVAAKAEDVATDLNQKKDDNQDKTLD